MQSLNFKNKIWNLCKYCATLNFSISLLLLICFFIMLGSIIEQNQSILYYKTYYTVNNPKLFFINWKFVLFLGLDNIYGNWWFISIIILFAFSLIICTLSTQLPSLRNSRRWKFFDPASKLSLDNYMIESNKFFNNSINNMIYSLILYNFYVFHKKYYIYSYKGILGRISPIFVHFSMILILLGSMFSFSFSLVFQEMVPAGEFFHLKNIINSGFYSNFNKVLIGKVDNFFIDYNLDMSIKQFFSKISLFDNKGNLLVSKVISVNSPFKFFNLVFYQTDWNMNLLRLKLGLINNVMIQKKLFKTNINNKVCWICSLPINNNRQIYIIISSLKDDFLVVDSDGLILLRIKVNQYFYINHSLIYIQEVLLDTGLQIKLDPGIEIIYMGFLILMITTIISYISYSQLWLSIINKTLNMAGNTNRAIFFFQRDIVLINNIYYKYTFHQNLKKDQYVAKFLVL